MWTGREGVERPQRQMRLEFGEECRWGLGAGQAVQGERAGRAGGCTAGLPAPALGDLGPLPTMAGAMEKRPVAVGKGRCQVPAQGSPQGTG